MRKDIFMVGARLLGVWQIIGAVNSLALIVAARAGLLHQQPAAVEYANIRFAAELVIGLYLVLKTEHLFRILTPAAQQAEAEQPEEQQ